MRRRYRIRSVLVALALFAPTLAANAAWVSTNDHFDRTWERTDKPIADGQASRTWIWGPRPFTEPRTEPYADSPDNSRLVQYFDKSRMEISNPNDDASSVWYVTNGLLATELISGQLQLGNTQFEDRAPANIPVAGDADNLSGPTYATFAGLLDAPATPAGWLVTQRVDRAANITEDPGLGERNVTVTAADEETGHSIALPFWSFMTSSGTVYDNGFTSAALFENPYFATGRPISEPYWASVTVAGALQDVLIQCFERRCLTYTPANAPEWQVEAGNVGQHYYTWRYNAPIPAPPALPEPPPPAPAPDPPPAPGGGCHPSYPTLCIPAPPPDLNCPDIPYRNFPVVGSDPHRFDGDNDGVGCES